MQPVAADDDLCQNVVLDSSNIRHIENPHAECNAEDFLLSPAE